MLPARSPRWAKPGFALDRGRRGAPVIASRGRRVRLAFSGSLPRPSAVRVAEEKLANAPRLSIVVLPFDNLSGDPEQDYFADGITDDLTTDLSHLRTASSSPAAPPRPTRASRSTRSRSAASSAFATLLEGSVRRVGEKITVNAQLVSTKTGAHVWADRFEGEREARPLQVEFVARLANSLGVQLVKAEALRVDARAAEQPRNCRRPHDAGSGRALRKLGRRDEFSSSKRPLLIRGMCAR